MIGRIYKLTVPETEHIYVGSTTVALSMRKALHKYQYLNKDYYKLSCASFDLLKLNDGQTFQLIELERYDKPLEQDCKSFRKQLRMREREITNMLKNEYNVVNKREAYTTKEEKLIYGRKNAQKNYYDENKYEENKAKRREAYYNNPEKLKELSKKWFSENEERVKAYRQTYYANRKKCEGCGKFYGCDLDKHLRSQPHKNNMAILNAN